MVRRLLSGFRVRRLRLFCLEDQGALQAGPARLPIAIAPATPADATPIAELRGLVRANAFGRYLAEGQLGVYAWLERRVVGHAWAVICRAERHRANGYFDLGRDEALIHSCYVDEAHRGQGIYPAMLAALGQRLFEEAGIRRIWIDTEAGNRASLRGIAKVGFKPVGEGLYIQYRRRLLFKRTRYDVPVAG